MAVWSKHRPYQQLQKVLVFLIRKPNNCHNTNLNLFNTYIRYIQNKNCAVQYRQYDGISEFEQRVQSIVSLIPIALQKSVLCLHPANPKMKRAFFEEFVYVLHLLFS